MKNLIMLVGTCVLCLASGAYGALQKPAVTYDSMSVVNIGAEGFTFNLNIQIHNPNSFSIPLGESTYALRIGDVPILQGRARPTGVVPANGVLPLTLPISLTWPNVLGAEEVMRHNRGDIPYTLEGQLGFGVNAPQLFLFNQPLRVPLRYSGVVPVRQWLKDPSLLLRSPALARLAQIALGHVLGQQTRPAAPSRELTPPRSDLPAPQ
jgi:LEA14-like dessication related protein